MSAFLLDGRNPEHRVYSVGGAWTPAARVDLNQNFWIRTLDASGNQVTPSIQSHLDLDHDALFPATGPIEVSGISAGDGIAIKLLDISPVTTGHMWTRPGLGFGPAPDFHVVEVDTSLPQLQFDDHRFTVPSRLHVGGLGVVPQEPLLARDVWVHGGNLDTYFLHAGSTLHLTAQQDGGGVFAADVHAAIGDAEICGTGVEAEAQLELRVERHGWAPSLPIVVSQGRVWVIGVGEDVEAALETSLSFIHSTVIESVGLSARDAYLTVSALLEVRICQVVNPHCSVAVSVGSGLDRHLVPSSVLGSRGDRYALPQGPMPHV